jgi:hypothetical protein
MGQQSSTYRTVVTERLLQNGVTERLLQNGCYRTVVAPPRLVHRRLGHEAALRGCPGADVFDARVLLLAVRLGEVRDGGQHVVEGAAHHRARRAGACWLGRVSWVGTCAAFVARMGDIILTAYCFVLNLWGGVVIISSSDVFYTRALRSSPWKLPSAPIVPVP